MYILNEKLYIKYLLNNRTKDIVMYVMYILLFLSQINVQEPL